MLMAMKRIEGTDPTTVGQDVLDALQADQSAEVIGCDGKRFFCIPEDELMDLLKIFSNEDLRQAISDSFKAIPTTTFSRLDDENLE
ncbi:MAG: hypothetical protein AAF916_06405 [Planctomycetota bacterium]